jgi:hypothetical protein
MTYVMILVIFFNGVTVTTVEFNSKEHCETALTQVDSLYTSSNVNAICVLK